MSLEIFMNQEDNKHDDGNGHAVYYPFNGIVVYFLKKKLAMLSKKGV